MADIVATDVTYALQDRTNGMGLDTRNGSRAIFKLTFGNGSLTYATSTGIPLTKGKLGCANALRKIEVLENAVTSGYVWDADQSGTLLRGFYQDCDAVADSGLIEIANGTAIAAQEVWVEAEGY